MPRFRRHFEAFATAFRQHLIADASFHIAIAADVSPADTLSIFSAIAFAISFFAFPSREFSPLLPPFSPRFSRYYCASLFR